MSEIYWICKACPVHVEDGAHLRCPLIAEQPTGGHGDVLPWHARGMDCKKGRWPKRARVVLASLSPERQAQIRAAVESQAKAEQELRLKLEGYEHIAGKLQICRAAVNGAECPKHFTDGGWDKCRAMSPSCKHCGQRVAIAIRDGKECPGDFWD